MESKLEDCNLKLSQPLNLVILPQFGWCIRCFSSEWTSVSRTISFLSSSFPDASANPRKFYWILESVSCHV